MTDDPAVDGAALLRDAEYALEAGDSARDVARAYLHRVDEADALGPFVSLLRDFDGSGSADDLVVDHLLDRRRNGAAVEAAGPGRIVNMADVAPETVRWLWPGRVPLGKVAIVDGDPGVLKSTLTLDLAARVTRAAAMPDGTESDLDGPRGVVLLTAEDGLSDTVRPRLDAAGADAVRVAALRGVATEAGERLPTVEDLDALWAAVEAVDAALVVVDPLVAYLGADVNSYRDQDVRAALAGLADLADEAGAAVMAVRHLNKSGGDNPIHRGGGSIGLIAAARAGLLVARDPDDPDGERRILAATKSNLAPEPPALAFRPRVADGTVAIAWEGETGHAARDLLATSTSEERTARAEARALLDDRLRNGPAPVEDLKREAGRLGISWRTMRRAKSDLDVGHTRDGFGGAWMWVAAPNSATGSGRERNPASSAENDDSPARRGSSGGGDSDLGHSPDAAENGDPDDPLQADLGAALDGGAP